jgi:hypothetical protein
MRCKIFGHKWNYYKEAAEHCIYFVYILGFARIFDAQFRICERCQYKQVREHFTDYWVHSELSKEQLREKKLKELGI